jgi:hypothetical protein
VQRSVSTASRKVEKHRTEQRGADRVDELAEEKDVHPLFVATPAESRKTPEARSRSFMGRFV